jgi:hypothetical protein
MLIEVMIGALILAMSAVAILNGLDGAQATGTRNKARSVAAALAEQDQERMRAMPVTKLAGYTNTRTVAVRGVNYTVNSKASWVTDQGGTVSCSSNSKVAANLRIVSQVTSPATRGVVDEASLVAPPPGTYAPGEGTVGVQVLDRNNAGISGLPVSLSGTASFSAVTNAAGCAVFAFIPVGPYTATLGSTTLVDFDGNAPETGSTSAVQGVTTVLQLQVDLAATINVNFNTVVNGTTVSSGVDSQWATVSNASLSAPFYKSFQTTSGTPNTLVVANPLYPFIGNPSYGVYAGQCTTNNPTTAPNSGSYATITPVGGPSPGGTATAVARVPSINLRVTDSGGTTAVNGATVKIKTADGCSTTYPSQTSAAATYGSTTFQGALPEPGFPYGKYQLCAQKANFPTAGVTTHGHADVNPYVSASSHVDEVVSNTAPNGNATGFNSTGAIRLRLNQTGPCEW